ncbi:MAG: DUF4236 domain-containing protein [Eubacteriales bacterium]|nr:DUF4236 domain-containing protein [Eubacteriales bacterium]
MGLRFRKSIKVAPGVKINLNKKSAGVTLGTKGAHYTINTSGKRTASVGLPGTGLSYSTSSGGSKKGSKRKTTKKDVFNKIFGVIIAVIAIVCVLGAIKTSLDKKAASAADTPAISAQADTSAVTDSSAVTDTSAVTDSSAVADAAADASQTKVWISASGSKYHAKSDCSGMENPTEITLQEALDMGKEACKRCNP